MRKIAARTLAFAAAILACGVWTQAAQAQAAQSIIGDWVGSLSVSGVTLRLVAHFAQKPETALTGTVDSLDQRANGIPFSVVTLTKSDVHLESKAIGATYDGTLSADGKAITGQWSQGGGSLPLTWTKTAHAPTLNRPQEPVPPYPYSVKDVTFPSLAAGVTLAGTLTEPSGAGPFPAVLLISGSGPNARDEAVFGHKPFLVLADYLTRQGFAVLRYDKRGIGQSTGNYKTATSADFADDAQGGVAYLKTLPEVNSKQIGLVGHSEGGLIAPMVAARSSDVAFIVLMAGTGLPGRQILLQQAALIGKAEGMSDAEIAKSNAATDKAFTIVLTEKDPAVAEKKLRALASKSVAQMTPAEKKKAGNVPAIIAASVKSMLSPWLRYFLAYDPAPTLRQVKCPVLALDGSRDLQVPPKEDLDAIGAALKAGGNTDYTVIELPNLNHLFQTSKTGAPSEYAAIEETISPLALTTISDWMKLHLAQKETARVRPN